MAKASWLLVVLVGCGGGAHGDAGAGGASSGGGGAAQSAGAGASVGGGAALGAGAGTADASPGAAGRPMSGGGDAGAAMSKAEACIAYASAVSARNSQCAGNASTSQPPTITTCPDVLFSDGSTRTVAGLLACIDAWRTFPCDQLAIGLDPPCVTPGTRAAGAPCLYPSQCASLQCLATSPCGVCAQGVGEGGDCSKSGFVCDFGLRCTSGKCVRIDPTMPVTPPQMPAQLQAGQPCMGTYQCMDSDYCDDLANPGMLVCTPLPKIGQMCTPAGSYCVKEGFCDTDNSCHALPTAGQPCGLLRGDPYWCAPMLFCDTSSTPAICRPYPHTGDICSARVACLDPGTACACSTPGCTTKHCLTVIPSGQPCGDPATTTCEPAGECRSSVCTPIDSQGLFEQACMH